MPVGRFVELLADSTEGPAHTCTACGHHVGILHLKSGRVAFTLFSFVICVCICVVRSSVYKLATVGPSKSIAESSALNDAFQPATTLVRAFETISTVYTLTAPAEVALNSNVSLVCADSSRRR